MNKFSIYVMKSFLKTLFLTSLLINLLLYLSAAYGNLSLLNGYEYNILDFIILTSYGIVLGINPLMPIIVAVSIMITMIMIMRNNELLAYMTIGGSIIRLAIPFIAIGCILVVCMIIIEYKFIPTSRETRETLLDKMKNRPPRTSHGQHSIWFINKNNVITYIGLVSYTDKTIYDIQEFISDDTGKLISIKKTEKVVKDGENWVAYNIKTTDIKTNPPKTTVTLQDNINDNTWDRLVSIESSDIRKYNPNELYTLIKLFKEKGVNTNNLEISLYFKYASAISVIVLILVIYPMSINFSRNYSIIKNATVTFSICLVFTLIQHSFLSLGNNGVFSPIVAVGSPIIIFLCVGLYIIYLKNKPT